MQKTTNYNLNQWEAGDRITRADFNDDNAKIDAALGSCVRMLYGRYTGDNNSYKIIDLGVTPKVVIIFMNNYLTVEGNNSMCGGIITPIDGVGNIVEGGFRVSSTMNQQRAYAYVAFY